MKILSSIGESVAEKSLVKKELTRCSIIQNLTLIWIWCGGEKTAHRQGKNTLHHYV